MTFRTVLYAFGVILLSYSCSSAIIHDEATHSSLSQYVDFDDSIGAVISISPTDGRSDTLKVDTAFTSIVCMSGSYAAAISAVGSSQAVTGVSGVRYLSDTTVKAAEIGYEAALDYETILRLKPDVVLAYSTSSVESDCWPKLRALGVRVFKLYDFLEQTPLARAEYIRALGRMTGHAGQADSLFEVVSSSYLALCEKTSAIAKTPKVLMNAPYNNAWFIPGQDGYMSQLVRDAGAVVLGSAPGSKSGTIGIEKAYELAAKADFWLHPGWCSSRDQIRSLMPLIAEFPVLDKEKAIYNNTLRTNPEGGNDFWESGALRPDLILEDMVRIFHPGLLPDSELHYYVEVE